MLIAFNKYQVYGKIAILSIFLLFFGLFIFLAPPLKSDVNPPVATFIFLIFFGFLFFCLAILMILQLLFLPKGVNINEENKFIILTFFAASSVKIELSDLSNYSSTLVKTKSTDYEGILLNLKNGKKYLLGDFNLRSYKPIKYFLEDCNVSYIGHEKFSFINYFIKYFNQ